MKFNPYSKEAIKARIYRLATSFWNVQNVDNVDPVVKLLMEAIAEEIYDIANNVNTMESRLLERLANILTPDILISPIPAHAILHTRSIEPMASIDEECYFCCNTPHLKKLLRIENLTFSPLCKSKVFNGDVRYIMANGLLYQYDKNRRKQMIARSEIPYTESNRVWIALELDSEITSLQDMSFYIDFPNTPDKYECLFLLPYSNWSINGSRIKMEKGMYIDDGIVENDKGTPFFKYEISNRIDGEILRTYRDHYMTVAEDIKIDMTKNTHYPEVLDLLFDEDSLETIQEEKNLWLCIDFPSNFTEYALDDLTVNINSVPVANKIKKVISGKVADILGIVPLKTDLHEYFLSMESIRDVSGKPYFEICHQAENEEEYAGTYSLRRGGCERFDARDAHEILTWLTDLLSEESAAFSYNQQGNIRDAITGMELLIKRMEQLNHNNIQEVPCYILIDNMSTDTFFDICFWATNCEIANKLKAGSYLAPSIQTAFNSLHSMFLTNTCGGKREPKSQERLDMYKYVLTTGDRVVTMDDIKNFCRMQLGNMMQDIQVSKGVSISEKPKEGLVRTIDVNIILKAHLKNIGNLDKIGGEIKSKLRDKSPDTYNYRVFVNSK